jgi:hypothetical protein
MEQEGVAGLGVHHAHRIQIGGNRERRTGLAVEQAAREEDEKKASNTIAAIRKPV